MHSFKHDKYDVYVTCSSDFAYYYILGVDSIKKGWIWVGSDRYCITFKKVIERKIITDLLWRLQ